jgi:ATP-dependent DNA ligase
MLTQNGDPCNSGYNEGNPMLPQISPAPLTSLKEPIGHPNWVCELKHDGFRGILYVDGEQAWLVSRKGKKFRQFDPLLK